MVGFDPFEVRRRAEKILDEARDAYESADYPRCVLRAQESVELSLKAMHVLFEGDFPRKHDIAENLTKISDKFPTWLKEKLGRIKIASRLLTEWKDKAKYGDESLKLSPERIFKESEAKLSLQFAEEITSDCLRIIMEVKEGAA
jgi:HEPN domain-containing protein